MLQSKISRSYQRSRSVIPITAISDRLGSPIAYCNPYLSNKGSVDISERNAKFVNIFGK